MRCTPRCKRRSVRPTPICYSTPTVRCLCSAAFSTAQRAGSEALFIDGPASEDQLNQLLGVTQLALPTAILADLTLSAFDTDLTSIANADYTFAVGDFQGYLTGGTAGDGLSFHTGDLGTFRTDLVSGLT